MNAGGRPNTVSYTHLRAHETSQDLVCRLLLEKKARRAKTRITEARRAKKRITEARRAKKRITEARRAKTRITEARRAKKRIY